MSRVIRQLIVPSPLVVAPTAWLECARCQGEGYLLSVGQPGEYSRPDETFLPSESVHSCPDCDGVGELEICATCKQVLEVMQGREVCGCSSLALPQAA